MYQLILIRHGQSAWNRDNRFTGWADVALTDVGEAQMLKAGRLLRQEGWQVDLAYTSMLSRCIRSLWALLQGMDRVWVPVTLDWRLNERHYGALTAMLKDQAIETYGADQVLRWRRSYEAKPPPYQDGAAGPVLIDGRYEGVPVTALPSSESLQQTSVRVRDIWEESISWSLRAGRRVLVMAHGNSLRALIKQIEGISDTAIMQVEVPNGVPWVYALDSNLQPLSRQILDTLSGPASEIL